MESWFVWALIGVACIGLEMMMPGFVIFFFGMGALFTALTCLIPEVSAQLWLQVLIFIVTSIFSLVILRRRFSKIFEGTVFNPGKSTAEEDGAGQTAEVLEIVSPTRDGRIRFRGTSWKARTREGEVAPGVTVRIVARDGLTYIVESTGGK